MNTTHAVEIPPAEISIGLIVRNVIVAAGVALAGLLSSTIKA